MKLLYDKLPTELLQLYIAQQVKLHPDLYATFLDRIMEMHYQNKIRATPLTILQHYYLKSQLRIQAAILIQNERIRQLSRKIPHVY